MAMPAPKPRSWPRLRQPSGELGDPTRIATAIRTARPGRRAREGIVEEDQEAVAGEVLERALVPEDEVPEGLVVVARGPTSTSSGSAVSANAVKPRRSQ